MSIDHGPVLTPILLQRRAIIYVRQSTQTQVMMNLESQRRQYDLVEAARSKARRGDLWYTPPIGSLWDRNAGVLLDPDLRIQDLGSARQILPAIAEEGIHFPRPSDGVRLTSFEWRPIRDRNVISVLKDIFYAGVYASGKIGRKIQIEPCRVCRRLICLIYAAMSDLCRAA
ncbi:hypothetical protein [Actibacterium sp. 188UL27-1]|uniref:hypothetical protein n=1 Tax=Actibacterium sp. 188UL27-1 TaxID=2786961 RepID=UPI001EF65089|nr:hypothetical protein [Actibacterium sp. 188UL27-1]